MLRPFIAMIVLAGILPIFAQQPEDRPSVYTAAQAEAGRTAYENSCGKCHALTLLGRNTVEDGLPPVDSLPASYQEFIRKSKHVPPLAGKVFLSR